MRVWSLRHPPVDRQGRCIGQSTIQTTEPLQASVRRVVASAPFEPTRLFCSDLPRCSQLAEGLANHWNIELEVTEDLREMHFGEWEGRSYDEIDATDTLRWRTWCEDWRNAAPPRGESLEQLMSRVSSWLGGRAPSERDLLVTHAGVIRVLRVLSGSTWDEAMSASCPFLGWQVHDCLIPGARHGTDLAKG